MKLGLAGGETLSLSQQDFKMDVRLVYSTGRLLPGSIDQLMQNMTATDSGLCELTLNPTRVHNWSQHGW